jgi:hypothetical protein
MMCVLLSPNSHLIPRLFDLSAALNAIPNTPLDHLPEICSRRETARSQPCGGQQGPP